MRIHAVATLRELPPHGQPAKVSATIIGNLCHSANSASKPCLIGSPRLPIPYLRVGIIISLMPMCLMKGGLLNNCYLMLGTCRETALNFTRLISRRQLAQWKSPSKCPCQSDAQFRCACRLLAAWSWAALFTFAVCHGKARKFLKLANLIVKRRVCRWASPDPCPKNTCSRLNIFKAVMS